MPFLFVILGSVASRGPWLHRLILLNGAIILGGIVAQAYMWQASPIKDAEGLFFGYLYILQLMLTASMLFWVFYMVSKQVRKHMPPNKRLWRQDP
jgi:hypothetical protein